jgi:hypothetical protein
MRIDARSFWFLDEVVELGLNLAVLCSPDIEVIVNRPSHGLDEHELAPMLASLCAAGFIEVKGPDDVLARTLREIEDAFAVSRCSPVPHTGFQYFLTPEGGAAWERLTRPDWSRYFVTALSRQETWIEAASLEAAEGEFRWEATDPSHVPVPGSEIRTVMRPWAATYWKTLPIGYKVHFRWTHGVGSNVLWSQGCPKRRPWYEQPKF